MRRDPPEGGPARRTWPAAAPRPRSRGRARRRTRRGPYLAVAAARPAMAMENLPRGRAPSRPDYSRSVHSDPLGCRPARRHLRPGRPAASPGPGQEELEAPRKRAELALGVGQDHEDVLASPRAAPVWWPRRLTSRCARVEDCLREDRWGRVEGDSGVRAAGVGRVGEWGDERGEGRRDSGRGRRAVPAELRRRWGLVDGGEVGFIDLGEAVIIVPGGVAAARAELRRVLDDRYEVGLTAMDDADVADQRW